MARNPIRKPDIYLQVVERVCEQRGLRLTALRAQVLRLVVAARRPIKAYEVLASLIDANGDTAPPTAYRALDFLTEHGFVHRLASLSSYVACACPERAHAVPFLICERCHSVAEIRDENIVALLSALALARGFQPRAQTLEVQGSCAACQKKALQSSITPDPE
jgi:Fur family zinc uptake transcriptional regulator